jgi:hypothetical protein
MRIPSSSLALGVFVVLLGWAVTIVSGKTDQANREQRRGRIAALTEIEKRNLARNYRRYQELPPRQREQMRTLYQQLHEQTPAAVELQHVMDEYTDWFATLTAGQRTDLRNEADPVRRAGMVRQLLAVESRTPSESSAGSRRRSFPGFDRFSRDDLTAVLDQIEHLLRKQPGIPDEQWAAVDSQRERLHHDFAVLKVGYGQSDIRHSPLWAVFESSSDSLIEPISDPAQQEVLRRQKPSDRVRMLTSLMMRSLWGELRARLPGQEKLEQFFVGLNNTQRDEIMSQPPDRQSYRLERLYMQTHPEVFPPDASELLRHGWSYAHGRFRGNSRDGDKRWGASRRFGPPAKRGSPDRRGPPPDKPE